MALSPKDASHVGMQLLLRAQSPTNAERIFTERVKQRPLHIKPTEPNNAQHQRHIARLHAASKKRKNQKPKPLSARRKRALCLYELPKKDQKYEIYEALHEMWVGYMHEILGLTGSRRNDVVNGPDNGALLASASYEGAEMEVVRSRCVGRVGIKGIIVRETRYTFEIITSKNEVKLVPKEHTIFRFVVPRPRAPEQNDLQTNGDINGDSLAKKEEQKDLVFELHGDQFEYRASDRANRKFKPHFLKNV